MAYAVTVHKAQGSEFPAVVLLLSTQHYMLLQRNLLYTALTRGRRLVVLLGSKKALAMAIANDKPVRRYTDLAAKLRQALPERAKGTPGNFLDNNSGRGKLSPERT